MVLGINQELVHEALGLVADVAIVFGIEAGSQDSVGELALVAPVVWKSQHRLVRSRVLLQHTVVGQKWEVLTLGVTAWNCRYHWPGRVDSRLLAEQVIGNLRITNPDMHFATDSGTEDTTIFITELLHGKPWLVWVDIVDASDVGDGARGTRDELQTRRRSVSQHVLYNLDRSNENEDASANEPFVGPNGVERALGLEKNVGGFIGIEVVVNLGHNDRRRDGSRHD